MLRSNNYSLFKNWSIPSAFEVLPGHAAGRHHPEQQANGSAAPSLGRVSPGPGTPHHLPNLQEPGSVFLHRLNGFGCEHAPRLSIHDRGAQRGSDQHVTVHEKLSRTVDLRRD